MKNVELATISVWIGLTTFCILFWVAVVRLFT